MLWNKQAAMICFDTSPPKYNQIGHIIVKCFPSQVAAVISDRTTVCPTSSIFSSLELLSLLTETQRTHFLGHTGVGDLSCVKH